jgi:ribonucleoside-diphosphate reductase alpha chain
MTLNWKGDDEHGYVGRVGDEELYRVLTWMSSPTGRGKNKKPGYRVFQPSQRSIFYPPLDVGPDKSSIVRTADGAKALCEADYSRTMGRERLSNRRACETFGFTHKQIAYTATIGRYADHRLAEIFIDSNKVGSDADAAAKDAAVVCSIALQYGAPADVIRNALLRDAQGSPCSPLAAALDQIAEQERTP